MTKKSQHINKNYKFTCRKELQHENNPVKTDNANLLATVYTNENKALLVIANWTDLPQKAKISIDEKALGFHPATISLPEIRDIQWGSRLNNLEQCEIMGRSGMIILLEK